jgi:hypothetical protein
MSDPRYLVVRFEGKGPACLGRVFRKEPERFYWSCYEMRPATWCGLGAGDEIVHEYPWVDPYDDDGLEAMELDCTRRFFHRSPAVIAHLDDKQAGWLAPDGRFFTCAYNGHDSLASILLAHEYGQVGNCVERLHEHGWLRIHVSGFTMRHPIYNQPFTQAQIDTMSDLSMAPRLSESYRQEMHDSVLAEVE